MALARNNSLDDHFHTALVHAYTTLDALTLWAVMFIVSYIADLI